MPNVVVAGQGSNFTKSTHLLVLDYVKSLFTVSTDPKLSEIHFNDNFSEMPTQILIVSYPSPNTGKALKPKVVGASRWAFRDDIYLQVYAEGQDASAIRFKTEQIIEAGMMMGISSLLQGAQIQLLQGFKPVPWNYGELDKQMAVSESMTVARSIGMISLYYHKVIV